MEQEKNRTSELFRVLDRLRKAWFSVVPGQTLSKGQFFTMRQITHLSGCVTPGGPPVALSALANTMRLSLPALSQRVRGLEERGYLERVPDPNDRRVTGVRLTLEGVRVMSEAKERLDVILSQSLEQIGPENADLLIALLAQLAESFEKAAIQSEEEDEKA